MGAGNVSPGLAADLDLCKQGEHTDLFTLVGLHSIAQNETVKWCHHCGSVVFTVLEGPTRRTDLKPRIFIERSVLRKEYGEE